MKRRHFFKQTGLGTAAIGAASAAALTSCSAPVKTENDTDDETILFIGEDIAVADTSYGKVKGYIMRGVHTFLGIPYAADASGKNRFMPPQQPEPWTNVRPAVFYGNSSPQSIYDRSPESYSAFIDHWNYDEISENCLRINVWTPALNDGKKRPVMVWLHGGGYSNGNGIEHDGYHGENFAKYGDVVYCSLNHRLGAIGFTDFSSVGGEKYKDSGNVGMLDILEAFKWIHENIANFGGDPDNVTVSGQSGGGGKVCTLSAMPGAKGLVHKAVALSGSSTEALPQDFSQKLGEYVLKEAGLTASQIDKLQDMPWEEYLAIANSASRKLSQDMALTNRQRGGFRPIADGVNIPIGQFYQKDATDSPNIPMLFCTTFHETSPSRTAPEVENITIDGVIEELKGNYGEKAAEIVNAYAKNFPDSKPVEILAFIRSNRTSVVSSANIKLKQGAPVYMAWFGWTPPLFDKRMRAFHCIDISFWFKNTDLMVTHSGGGARPRRLSTKMADAMLNFMRTGDPNGGELPAWPEYTEENGETMVLNDVSTVQNDPDRAARNSLS